MYVVKRRARPSKRAFGRSVNSLKSLPTWPAGAMIGPPSTTNNVDLTELKLVSEINLIEYVSLGETV